MERAKDLLNLTLRSVSPSAKQSLLVEANNIFQIAVSELEPGRLPLIGLAYLPPSMTFVESLCQKVDVFYLF